VFTGSGSSWTQQAQFAPATLSGKARFGTSVALSSNGDAALVGAPDDGVDGGSGAAFVFARAGTTWAQQGPLLTAADESTGGGLGDGVALSPDGGTALIAGAQNAWVFSPSGSVWSQQGPDLGPGVEAPVALAQPSSCTATALWGQTVYQSSTCSYPGLVASTPGLLGYWRLGESSGTTATDLTGAHDGTYQGGYTLGVAGALTGDTNTAAAFNGTTGYVELPALGSSSDWTIEGWTDLAGSATGNNALFAGFGGPRLLVTPDGYYADDYTNATAAGKMHGATASNIGTWAYWALVRNGSTLTVYRDGVELASSSLAGEGPTTLTGDIGAESNGAYHLAGAVDEVAVYDTALPAATLLEHYVVGAFTPAPYAATVRATSGLTDWWRLGDTSGSTAVDQVGAANGTYTGGYTLGVPSPIFNDRGLDQAVLQRHRRQRAVCRHRRRPAADPPLRRLRRRRRDGQDQRHHPHQPRDLGVLDAGPLRLRRLHAQALPQRSPDRHRVAGQRGRASTQRRHRLPERHHSLPQRRHRRRRRLRQHRAQPVTDRPALAERRRIANPAASRQSGGTQSRSDLVRTRFNRLWHRDHKRAVTLGDLPSADHGQTDDPLRARRVAHDVTLGRLLALPSLRQTDMEVEHVALGVVVGVIEHERSDADGHGLHSLGFLRAAR
jgi:hypothetical protein